MAKQLYSIVRYLIFQNNCPPFLKHQVQQPTNFLSPSEIRVFSWTCVILVQFLSRINVHFRCNFINAEWPAQTHWWIWSFTSQTQWSKWSFISSCYNQWQPEMNIFKNSHLASSQSFHKFTNFHLPHIVVTILKCYCSVHVTTKIISYRAVLLCNLSKTATILNMSQYYHY